MFIPYNAGSISWLTQKILFLFGRKEGLFFQERARNNFPVWRPDWVRIRSL